jgi:hypothetical protein
MEVGYATTNKDLHLYSAETVLGWRVVRRVSLAQGLKKEEAGVWRRVLEAGTGQLMGFQMVGSNAARVDRDIPTIHSSAAITAREMGLNVEHSRTMGMDEERRDERVAAGLAPEDAAERVQCKVMVYPYVNGRPGDIVRVWPRTPPIPAPKPAARRPSA